MRAAVARGAAAAADHGAAHGGADVVDRGVAIGEELSGMIPTAADSVDRSMIDAVREPGEPFQCCGPAVGAQLHGAMDSTSPWADTSQTYL